MNNKDKNEKIPSLEPTKKSKTPDPKEPLNANTPYPEAADEIVPDIKPEDQSSG